MKFTDKQQELLNKLAQELDINQLEQRSSDKNPKYFTTGANNIRLEREIEGVPHTVSISFSATYIPVKGDGNTGSKQYKTTLKAAKRITDKGEAIKAAQAILASQGIELDLSDGLEPAA